MRKWLILLSITTVYVVCLAIVESARTPMALDEFLAWNLLSDPSFLHAIGSWSHGADSGGVLYYILLWPVAHLTHGSVLAVRLCSALAYVFAGVVWWRLLSWWLPTESAALGITLVWLSTGFILAYVAQVRFYTFLLLFAAFATAATVRALDQQKTSTGTLLLVVCGHMCLLLIHMLGVLYSTLLIGFALFSGAERKRSLLVATAGASSWLVLLACRTAIANGSANAVTLLRPTFFQLVRYYLRWSAPMPVLLLAFLGLAWIIHDRYSRKNLGRRPADLCGYGPIVCVAFLPAPLCLYLLSVLVRPLGAERYLIPYYLCMATLCAYALSQVQSKAGRKYGRHAAIIAVLLILFLHLRALRTLPKGPALDVRPLLQVAKGKPIVVLDEQLFFRLQYYHSNQNQQFYYLRLANQDHPSRLMAAVADRGYFARSFPYARDFGQVHPEFFMVAPPVSELAPWVAQNHTCQAHNLGIMPIDPGGETVYEIKGCRLR